MFPFRSLPSSASLAAANMVFFLPIIQHRFAKPAMEILSILGDCAEIAHCRAGQFFCFQTPIGPVLCRKTDIANNYNIIRVALLRICHPIGRRIYRDPCVFQASLPCHRCGCRIPGKRDLYREEVCRQAYRHPQYQVYYQLF